MEPGQVAFFLGSRRESHDPDARNIPRQKDAAIARHILERQSPRLASQQTFLAVQVHGGKIAAVSDSRARKPDFTSGRGPTQPPYGFPSRREAGLLFSRRIYDGDRATIVAPPGMLD